MKRRGVRVRILFEDDAQWTFARHVFLVRGYHHREIRGVPYVPGQGSAEQRVRDQYPQEVKGNRSRRKNQQVELLVVIDADTSTVDNRKKQLATKLKEDGLAARSGKEPIVVWIPKRCVETWIAWLSNHDVTERTESHRCKNLVRDCDYRPPARKFVDGFRQPDQVPGLLPSIRDAHAEMKRLPV